MAPLLDLTSIYSFDDTATFAEASHDKVGAGYVYGRWANPTVDAFEAAVADLEGAEAAEAFSSGMAAISSIFLALCSVGDRVASVRQLYGNSYSLLTQRLPRFGIEANLCDIDDFDGVAEACEGAKLLYCETIGNPRGQVADLPRLAAIANDAGIPLAVDNTFASPILCRPIEHGATIVVHSATKFIGGHHDLIGGIVCTDHDTIEPIRSLARDIGPTLAPFNAWLALRGIATLPVRVQRANENAVAVAEALHASEHVENVYLAGLEGSPDKALADALLGGWGGATFGFDVAGGRERASRFQEMLQVVKIAASLGGSHTLVVHPASVTHTQLSPEELISAGMGEGFCRISVGLEDPADIIADLEQALIKSA